jgi:hypothetical protein
VEDNEGKMVEDDEDASMAEDSTASGSSSGDRDTSQGGKKDELNKEHTAGNKDSTAEGGMNTTQERATGMGNANVSIPIMPTPTGKSYLEVAQQPPDGKVVTGTKNNVNEVLMQ